MSEDESSSSGSELPPSRTSILNNIAAGGRVSSSRPAVRRVEAEPTRSHRGAPAPAPAPVPVPAPLQEAARDQPLYGSLYGYFRPVNPSIPLAEPRSSKKQKRAAVEMVPHPDHPTGNPFVEADPQPGQYAEASDAMDVEEEISSDGEDGAAAPEKKKARRNSNVALDLRLLQFPGQSFCIVGDAIYCIACKKTLANDSATLKQCVSL